MDNLREWVCTRCGATFKSGQWLGCRGTAHEAHEVAIKTYYSAPTPFLLMQWKTDRRVPDQAGRLITIGGKSAQFKDGQHFTGDPEEQEHMDACVERCTLQTAQQYLEATLTPKQKLDRQAIQIEEQSRLITKLQKEREALEQGVIAQNAQQAEAPKMRKGSPRAQ